MRFAGQIESNIVPTGYSPKQGAHRLLTKLSTCTITHWLLTTNLKRHSPIACLVNIFYSQCFSFLLFSNILALFKKYMKQKKNTLVIGEQDDKRGAGRLADRSQAQSSWSWFSYYVGQQKTEYNFGVRVIMVNLDVCVLRLSCHQIQ